MVPGPRSPGAPLGMIGARDREVIETRRPERNGLRHGQDGLGFGEAPGSFLEVQGRSDRGPEADRVGCGTEQDRARVRGQIAICGGNRKGARGPVYAHLRDASFAGGWLPSTSSSSLLRRLFSWTSAREVSPYRWFSVAKCSRAARRRGRPVAPRYRTRPLGASSRPPPRAQRPARWRGACASLARS